MGLSHEKLGCFAVPKKLDKIYIKAATLLNKKPKGDLHNSSIFFSLIINNLKKKKKEKRKSNASTLSNQECVKALLLYMDLGFIIHACLWGHHNFFLTQHDHRLTHTL